MNKKRTFFSVKLLVACCLLGIFFLPASLYAADWLNAFGVSPRAMAMGNAYTALSDDVFGAAYNPAGAAVNPRSALTIGYLYNQPRVKLSGPAYSGKPVAFEEIGKAPFAGFSLHMGWMFESMNKSMKKTLSFLPKSLQPEMDAVMTMVAAMMHGGRFMNKIDTVWDEGIKFPVFSNAYSSMCGGGGFAMKYNDKFYFGQAMRTEMVCNISDGNWRMVYNANYTSMEFDYDRLGINCETGFLPVIGVLVIPVDDVRVGVLWKDGGGSLNFHGTIGAHMIDTAGRLDYRMPPMPLSMWDLWNPEEVSVSVACQVTDRLLVALEGSHLDFTGYILPYGQKPSEEKPDDDTWGLTIPRTNPFQPVIVSRIGLEYEVNEDLKARAGYYWHPPVVKKYQPYTRLLDTHKHVFSAGIGYLWRYPERLIGNPLEIDFTLYYQHLAPRTFLCLTGGEPSADPGAVPGYITMSGYLIGGGIMIQMKFDD